MQDEDREFSNVYEDQVRAMAYANLEFPGTYFLAYRDLPVILHEHVQGKAALDFGCGTGRSTRFLQSLGFAAVGVDISSAMLDQARARDPQGEYVLQSEADFGSFTPGSFDLVFSAFTFDNVPTMERKVVLLRSLRSLLRPTGRILNLVSTPEIYLHEWASFSTRDFPENQKAETGEKVRIVILDVKDSRPVEDILWKDEDYREVYRRSGLACVRMHRPLGKANEDIAWISERTIAPWAVYVLAPADSP